MVDMSASTVDMQAAGLTLSGAGRSRSMAAYYSYYVRPLSDDSDAGVYLVITAIDPAFRCQGGDVSALDALSFLFPSRTAGAVSATVIARHGPALGATTGSGGTITLDSVDDRLGGYDLDGGVVTSGDGSVTGHAAFTIDSFTLDGSFTAPRCAALDFIVPG
jgi:hypothetical protein